MLRSSLFFVFILLLISSVSATGLRVNETMININKTVGNNQVFTFTLINDENFSFYNITFVSDKINFPNITEFPANQNAKIDAVFKSDTAGVTSTLIKGFYSSNVGQEFKTYDINVSNSAPFLSSCDLTLVVGDSIRWNNQVLDAVIMEDSASVPVEGGSILTNQSYLKQFNSAGLLVYHFKRSGFTFTPSCTISIVNASGMVNNQLYDGVLDVNVNLKYDDTLLSVNILNLNYTMDFNDNQDGIFSVTNIGNKTAVGITLSGEWFLFNSNNFNLNPGQTKGIIYTIVPIITNSNQTNIHHYQNITISGNFNSQTIPFDILINTAIIGASDNSTDADYLIRVFCPKYPNSTLCNPNPRVEYRYIDNSSDRSFNVSMTQKQFEDIWSYLFSINDEGKISISTIKSMIFDIVNNQNSTTTDIKDLRVKFDEDKTAREKTLTNTLLFVGVAFTLLTTAIAGSLIYLYRKRKVLEASRKW